MELAKRSLACAVALTSFYSSPAMADLRSYKVVTVNPSGTPSQGVVHVYRLGSPKIRARVVRSESINLAQAANEHKSYPLVVSGGGFTAQSNPSGLIAVNGDFLSRLASPQAMPTLLCFNERSFQIKRVAQEKGALLPEAASACLAAVQSLPLFIDNGKKTRTETKPLAWSHVFVAHSASDLHRVIIVEGTLSAASLSEFLAGAGKPCPAMFGTATTYNVRIQVQSDGSANASCNLSMKDVATLNLGSATGAIHYGVRLAGDDAAEAPIALLFDD